LEAERNTENIRRKVREYPIKHPVVNEGNQVIWRRFGVDSWPTLALSDANEKLLGGISGEGHFADLDQVIGRLVERHQSEIGVISSFSAATAPGRTRDRTRCPVILSAETQ
jgi:hypothetical protein